MANFFGNLLTKIKEFWKNAKKSTKVQIIAGTIALIIAVIVISAIAGQVDYVPLYSGLDSAEAGDIYNNLKDKGIDVKIEGQNTVMVPKELANELRVTLSAEGYPKSGLSYDIIQNAAAFGTTDLEKQAYLQFQLQQNVSQMIKGLDGIKDAKVMISMPKSSNFVLSSAGNQPASAAVVLTIANGKQFTNADADAVRSIVAMAIPQLDPANITIVDSSMKRYTPEEEGAAVSEVTEQMNLTQRMESTLQFRILNLLTPVFGPERVSIAVNAALDFDLKTSESVEFNPPVPGDDKGLIVSQKSLVEKVVSTANTNGEAPGFDPNGATVVYPDTAALNDPNSVYYKETIEYNAEINEVREQIKSAQGSLKDLSISVILDGDETVDELLPEVSKLVSTGIGVDPNKVTVSRIPFMGTAEAKQAIADEEQALKDEEAAQQMQQYIIYGAIVLALLAIIILTTLSRKKKKRAEQQVVEQQAMEEALARQREEETQTAGSVDLVADEELSIDDLLKPIDQATVNNIRSMVEKNPESIAQLLRNWLVDTPYRR